MFYLDENLDIVAKPPKYIEAMSDSIADLVAEREHCIAVRDEQYCAICEENHESLCHICGETFCDSSACDEYRALVSAY